jgi:GTPase Era involved in 16S rRNA processing
MFLVKPLLKPKGLGGLRILDGDFDIIYQIFKEYPVIVVINKVDQADLRQFKLFFQSSLKADEEYRKERSIKKSNIHSWVATR